MCTKNASVPYNAIFQLCRLLEELTRCAASAPTAVLLVKACLEVQTRQPEHEPASASETTYPSARVLKSALAAASIVGDSVSSRLFFEELKASSGSIDGQAFGLLIAAHGQVSY